MLEEQPIIDFIQSPWRNQWVVLEYGEIYLRKSKRFIDRNTVKALDVANIEFGAKHRGKGHFTRILSKIEKLAKEYGYEVVYLENVHNDRLGEFYIKQGYIKHHMYDLCYWKKV